MFKFFIIVIANHLFSKCPGYESPIEARRDYDEYLYHFSLYARLRNRSNEDELNKISKRDPRVMLEVPVFTCNSSDTEEEVRKIIDKALNCDLAILRDFLPRLNLDNSKFTMNYLRNNCNIKNQIDVINQSTKLVGFSKNKHLIKKMTLKKYLDYVMKKEQEGANSKSKSKAKAKSKSKAKSKISIDNSQSSIAKKKNVDYGVNIELTDYPELQKELETHVHPLLLFGSEYDALKYVRQHINGMTIPQMYIKVKDVWTGGHEENLRMRSININHGPGDSLWWCTPVEDSKKLAEQVSTEYGMNIYKEEGIWFPEMDFFYRNRIKMQYTLQKPGDILLVGPGTLHWVKAKSHAINTSWNFSHKDCKSLNHSMDRYELNTEIKFKSLVPMQTLILDILNHEMYDLSKEYVQTCIKYLEKTINEAINKKSEINKELQQKNLNISLVKEPDDSFGQNCDNCNIEIFNYWGHCEICSKETEKYILCLNCFMIHLNKCKEPNSPKNQLYFKYEEKDLIKFLQRVDNRLKLDKEVQTELIKKTKDYNTLTNKKRGRNDEINLIISTFSFSNFKKYYLNFFKNYRNRRIKK
jgi:hypothetical protein